MTDTTDMQAGATSDTTDNHHAGVSATTDSLSLAEAAARLGVSERTVLRRIEKGGLSGHKVAAERGEVWRVSLDGMTDTHDNVPAGVSAVTDNHSAAMTDTADSTPAPELMKALEIVDRLQRDNQQLAGQVGYLQARVQDQERQIGLLMAPKDEPAPEPEPTLEPAPSRPWWRRLLG